MGRPAIDLTGQRFGMLEVIKRYGSAPNDKAATWLCKCDCGNTKVIRGTSLKAKDGTRSCGCLSRQIEDLTGNRYGTLTVKRIYRNEASKKKEWLCVCDCGNEVVVSGGNLKDGHTQHCLECGYKLTANAHRTHGKSQHPLFGIWYGIISRCESNKSTSYKNYGGRGISICEEWRNDFQAFYDWCMENGYKKGLQIDIIDNDGNYEPNNCRWVTRTVNANNKRSNVFIEYNGEVATVAEMCRKYDAKYKYIHAKIREGFTFDGALRQYREYKSKTVRGVNKNHEKYYVRISINKEVHKIGSYYNYEEAKEARRQAELKYWGYTNIKTEDEAVAMVQGAQAESAQAESGGLFGEE
jgi:hypothetical protein